MKDFHVFIHDVSSLVQISCKVKANEPQMRSWLSCRTIGFLHSSFSDHSSCEQRKDQTHGCERVHDTLTLVSWHDALQQRMLEKNVLIPSGFWKILRIIHHIWLKTSQLLSFTFVNIHFWSTLCNQRHLLSWGYWYKKHPDKSNNKQTNKRLWLAASFPHSLLQFKAELLSIVDVNHHQSHKHLSLWTFTFTYDNSIGKVNSGKKPVRTFLGCVPSLWWQFEAVNK